MWWGTGGGGGFHTAPPFHALTDMEEIVWKPFYWGRKAINLCLSRPQKRICLKKKKQNVLSQLHGISCWRGERGVKLKWSSVLTLTWTLPFFCISAVFNRSETCVLPPWGHDDILYMLNALSSWNAKYLCFLETYLQQIKSISPLRINLSLSLSLLPINHIIAPIPPWVLEAI